ncbi:hypothetical protein KAH94_03165 [bacterium]|nr:hypothetical protein [bacterium]
MFGKNKFLENCKKVFNQNNLVLYEGKYPFNKKANEKRDNIDITPQQKFVCNLLIDRKIPFIIEYKILASFCNHFYCDILAQGKYHIFDIEIDGKQHLFQKSTIISDLKKDKYLMFHREIFTIRIDNDIVDDYYSNPEALEEKLKYLNYKLYAENGKGHGKIKEKHIYIAEKIGGINKRIRDAKSKKN